MNKKGLFGLVKLVITIAVILIVLIVLGKYVGADSIINIVNITSTQINSSNTVFSIGGITYYFNSSNFTLQHNFTVSFNGSNATIFLNTTNTTQSIIVGNGSINVTCSCPSAATYNVTTSCSGEIDLTNSTKTEFFNHYITSLSSKIEESSNKVAQDVIFKLEPAKAELESCRQSQLNSSIKEQEANRQRDKIASDNLAISNLYSQEKQQNKWILTASGFMVVVFLVFLFSPRLQDVIEDIKHMKGGGAM